jgi:hypothetical protein
LDGLKCYDIPETMRVLEALRTAPSMATLSRAMHELASAGEGHCYAHEAWFDMARAIGQAAIDTSTIQRVISSPYAIDCVTPAESRGRRCCRDPCL